MARRKREPDEELGPAIDGTEDLMTLAKLLIEPVPPPMEEETEELPDPAEPQIVLICGEDDNTVEMAKLAAECGFEIELVSDSETPLSEELVDLAKDVHILEHYENLVKECNVDRNHYICIFVKDAEECGEILFQCLASDAAYVGACTDPIRGGAIMRGLKAGGAPDAELAAVCCPMGLSIGAETAMQQAVAIVGELMAARSGTLKRLRSKD